MWELLTRSPNICWWTAHYVFTVGVLMHVACAKWISTQHTLLAVAPSAH